MISAETNNNKNTSLDKFNIQEFVSSFPIDPYFYYVVLLKYKKQLLSIPLLIGLVIFLISKSLTPVYQSSASLIIETENTNIIDIDEVYDPSLRNNQKSFLNTQVQILNSKEIISRMLDNNDFIRDLEKLMKQQQSNNFWNKLKKRLNRFQEINLSDAALVNFIKSTLVIKADNSSNIIRISSSTYDPSMTNLILNQLIDSYRRYDVDQKIAVTSYANEKINERILELKKTLDESENALYEFKKNNELIDLGDIKNLKTDEIKALSSQLLEAERDYQKLGNDLQQLKLNMDNYQELATISVLKDFEEIKILISDLEASQINIESMLVTYTTSHPKIIKLQETKDNMQNQLNNKIDEVMSTLTYDYANLASFIEITERKIDEARVELQELELKDIEMQKYVREVEMNENIYQSFLERLKETSEAKELQTPNGKILDIPSTPTSPISPNIQLNTITSIFLTFLLIYMIALYFESYKITVNDPNDIEKHGYEILNLIPKVAEPLGYHVPINFIETDSGPLKESIIATRTIMKSQYKNAKCFLITSPMAGEGKTTMSLNLALAHAVGDKKVIFLETDFRRPSVAKVLELENQKGLSQLMKGEAEFSDVIINIYNSSLDIILAGESTNSSNYLNSENFNKFIEVLKKKYDYVFLDTAPIQPIADTLLYLSEADVTLIVLRSRQSKLGAFTSALNKINKASNCDVGILLNYFDTQTASTYGYAHYYYDNKYYGEYGA